MQPAVGSDGIAHHGRDSYRIRTDLGVLRWTAIAMLLRRPVAVHRSTGRISVEAGLLPAGLRSGREVRWGMTSVDREDRRNPRTN